MRVTVYSIPSCPKCAAAKTLLKRKGISFEETDIHESHEKNHEMLKKLEKAGISPLGVMMPVLDIEGTIIVGFDKGKIENVLKENALIKEQQP
jgi:glutaredoxin